MNKKLLVLITAACIGYTNQAKAQAGAALNFDGVSSYITVNEPTGNLDNLGMGNFTTEAWVNISSYTNPNNSGINSIFRKSGDYNLYINNGVLNAEVWPNGMNDATWQQIIGSTMIPLNTWVHVAFTFNHASNTAALYVNGVAEATSVNSNNISGNEPLWLGMSSNYSQPFEGSMDEAKIFNYDLSACQINTGMNCELAPSAGLLLYYQFNQGIAGATNLDMTTIDASGNGNMGNLYSFALSGATSNWVAPGGVISGVSCGPVLGNVIITPPNLIAGITTTLTASGASTYSWSTGATTASIVVTPTANATYSVTGSTGACSSTFTTSMLGGALNLDGNATYVDYGNNPALGLQSNNFSMEAWVNPTGGSGGQLILFNGACNVSTPGWGLSYNGGDFTGVGTANPGKLSFYVSSVDNNYYQLDQQSALPTGAWTHVAVTNDGTGLKMYINGVLDNSLSGNFIPVNTNSSFKIGADPDDFCDQIPRYVYNGSIDELRLYNYALTQCQISATMNCELSQSKAGLILYDKFNQGIGNGLNTLTTIDDSSSSAIVGYMHNFALNGTTSNWVLPGAVSSGISCPFTLGAVGATASNPAISIGGTSTLTGVGATTYTWTDGNQTTASIVVSPTVTTTYSITGSDGNCTSMGVVTVTVAPAAAALNFNGNNFVSVPTNPALDFGTNDFTIEADIQTSVSQSDYTGIAVKSNNGDPFGGYQLVMVNNNIAAEFSDNNGNFFGTSAGLQGTTDLTDGNWHHLAMVVNRANNNIKLLVDGIVEADVTDPAISTTDISNPAEDMLIGVERTHNIFTTANFDEVRVWNRALCAAEIQNNMPGELPKNSNGLVAYYKFNQGFDNVDNSNIANLADSSGNGYNGVFYNFPRVGTTANFIAGGAVTSGSIVATFTNNLSAVATQTNVTCNSTNNGIASVTPSGTAYTPYTYAWSTGDITATASNLAIGNYTCVINNGCGVITETVAITQPNTVDASVTNVGNLITATDANATYQWVDCNNSNAPIAGETNQSFTAVSSGNYAVIVTEGSCVNTSTCTLISTTGIAKNNSASGVSVYPNPFTNNFTIVSSAKTNAMLFDVLGNKIAEYTLQSTTQTISVGDVAPGIYYLQVDAQKIKIIKQ